MKQWNLFEQQPLNLEHPAGMSIPVAAVSPVSGGVVWWNADYMLAAALPGGTIGASGFLNYHLTAAPEWHEEDGAWWVIIDGRAYKFHLPGSSLKKQWKKYGSYLQPIEELHRIAVEQYGGNE